MKRMFFTALLASTVGAVAFPAPAQPAHGGSPLEMLEMLGRLKPQLNLNTSQQQQWDNVVAQSNTTRDAARANFEEVKAALQAELAKSEPDFAAVAAIADNAQQKNAALHKQTRDAWLALYATFGPEQKAVARDAVNSGIARMQAQRAARRRTPPSN
jgi:Spy/CpxP family protein refolding chaperone